MLTNSFSQSKAFENEYNRNHSRFNFEDKYPNNIVFLFQEHPSFGGTPLAMLAAQCSKISSKSPPPLADAAVG